MIWLGLIVFLGAAIAIAKPAIAMWKNRKAENALRADPPPMLRFQVKLPADSSQTNMMMSRFWDRIHRHLPNDDKILASNSNVLHAAIVGYGTEAGRAPRVCFMVWCHPDLAEKVQLDLSECYNDEVQILSVDEEKDPLGQWLQAYRADLEYQRQLSEAESSSKTDSNDIDDDDDD